MSSAAIRKRNLGRPISPGARSHVRPARTGSPSSRDEAEKRADARLDAMVPPLTPIERRFLEGEARSPEEVEEALLLLAERAATAPDGVFCSGFVDDP